MSSELKECCPHCGQSVMKHTHSMSESMANTFLKVPMFVKFHLQKDLTLTKNQYANFQKLKYWGLVEQVKDQSGWWRVTEYGRRFAFGEISISKSVITFNNRAVDTHGPFVFIYQCTGTWKKREEYAKTATPQMSFA